MAESADDGTARSWRVWVRRCRSCGRDDHRAAFGQPALADGPWTCPACGGDRHEPVPQALPPTAGPGCPAAGAA